MTLWVRDSKFDIKNCGRSNGYVAGASFQCSLKIEACLMVGNYNYCIWIKLTNTVMTIKETIHSYLAVLKNIILAGAYGLQ